MLSHEWKESSEETFLLSRHSVMEMIGLIHRGHGRLCCYFHMWYQECGQVSLCPHPHQYLIKSVSSHIYVTHKGIMSVYHAVA